MRGRPPKRRWKYKSMRAYVPPAALNPLCVYLVAMLLEADENVERLKRVKKVGPRDGWKEEYQHWKSIASHLAMRLQQGIGSVLEHRYQVAQVEADRRYPPPAAEG